MESIFITDIHIRELLHLNDIRIPLDKETKKHLILTGKNGSGKTSVLREIEQFFNKLIIHVNKEKVDLNIVPLFHSAVGVYCSFKKVKTLFEEIVDDNFLFQFFSAKRNTNFFEPLGIEKIDFKKNGKKTVGDYFVQYLLNLKADQSFALNEKENEEATKIDNWFNNFENQLKEIFENKELSLKFIRKDYNFQIEIPDRLPFSFTQLPDGQDSILFILTNILMEFEKRGLDPVITQGIILIDEIETHLHISLQKKILPFLTSFFPNIQFIVTTHSPFVINSIEDAVIFDLEHKKRVEDLSMYSSEGIVEAYFENDKYSDLAKTKLARYEELATSGDLSENEEDELDDLIDWLEEMPDQMAPELALHFKMLELKRTQQTY